MKKLFISILLFSMITSNVYALDEIDEVELIKCDSISNIWVKTEYDIKRIHLLAFETTSGKLDNEINTYVCEKLKSAEIIRLEYDVIKKDKYNRDLVYVYLDGVCLQEDLINKGYGQVANITTTLKYTSKLCDIQKNAIKNNTGIWKYPNIKEEYCNSGISLNNETNTFEQDKYEETENNTHVKYIIMINSGILVLLLLMKKEF